MMRSTPWRALSRIAATIILVADAHAVSADGGGTPGAEGGAGSPYAIQVFGGEGSGRDLSGTLSHPNDYQGTADHLLAVAGTRDLFWLDDNLSVEAEALYGYHFGRDTYHEVGTSLAVRWHDFPWNETVVTTLAVGTGPSYTTGYGKLESQGELDERSRWLNQFNLSATFALPENPSTALLLRVQHRSGAFGIVRGVHDASNFVTIGVRQSF